MASRWRLKALGRMLTRFRCVEPYAVRVASPHGTNGVLRRSPVSRCPGVPVSRTETVSADSGVLTGEYVTRTIHIGLRRRF